MTAHSGATEASGGAAAPLRGYATKQERVAVPGVDDLLITLADCLKENIRTAVNDPVLREPLELVKHIVRNDRPFTGIVTADYIMVSPYTSQRLDRQLDIHM